MWREYELTRATCFQTAAELIPCQAEGIFQLPALVYHEIS